MSYYNNLYVSVATSYPVCLKCLPEILLIYARKSALIFDEWRNYFGEKEETK